jgi:prepilin-type processing-associated H-X9-DG protein
MTNPFIRLNTGRVCAALLCTASLLCTAACLSPALSLQSRPDTVAGIVSGTQAYVLGPVELVAQGETQMWEASPRGRYALIVHAPPARSRGPLDIDPVPDGPWRVTLWDSHARRTTTVWRAESADPRFSIAVDGYFHGTDTAVLAFQTLRLDKGDEPSYETVLRRFDAPTTTLGAPVSGWNCSQFAPGTPVALLENDNRFAFWKPTGAPVPLTRLPANTFFAGWFQKGTVAGFELRQKLPGNKRTSRRWFVAQTSDGLVREVPALPAPDPDPPTSPAPIVLESQPSELVRDNTKVAVQSLWLEIAAKSAKNPAPTIAAGLRRTPVAAAHDRPLGLLADQSGVLWEHDGNVYGRSIARVPRTTFETLRATLGKRKAMSDAKQIALGLMMFAMDNDERFPATSALNEILPYVKNQEMIERFQFTYSGNPDLAKIESPAETVLGHVDGPGGRAVAYADGHVAWQDNPPAR